jgi:hypothetical protein
MILLLHEARGVGDAEYGMHKREEGKGRVSWRGVTWRGAAGSFVERWEGAVRRVVDDRRVDE